MRPDPSQVQTREELATYLAELSEAVREGLPDMAHEDIAGYIDGLGGVVGDLEGICMWLNQPLPNSPSWQLIAELVTDALRYE